MQYNLGIFLIIRTMIQVYYCLYFSYERAELFRDLPNVQCHMINICQNQDLILGMLDL